MGQIHISYGSMALSSDMFLRRSLSNGPTGDILDYNMGHSRISRCIFISISFKNEKIYIF